MNITDQKSSSEFKTAIVGMGALGLLYGEQIQNALGRDSLCFVMDSERYLRHKDQTYTINGVPQDFTLIDAAQATPVDLVIVATKATDLDAALDVVTHLVDDHTILISVLNGISSEQILAERFGDQNLIYAVALGMDAVREGQSLQYENKGKLQIGILKEAQRPALERLQSLFDSVGQAYTVETDILRALWGKFMLNVGINQTCMVFETNYGGAVQIPEYFAAMNGAMHEVLTIAQKEGIQLTEQDIANYIQIIKTLKPEGYPSMRQDALARRKSEVELFAGTILRLAKKHQLPAPINEFFYRRIQEIEAAY